MARISADQRQALVEFLESRGGAIVERTLEEGRRRGNKIVLDAAMSAAFVDQIGASLDQVRVDIGGARGRPYPADDQLSKSIGSSRATQGIDTAESCAAAQIFFGVAAAALLDGLRTDMDLVKDVLASLHRSVMERLLTASASYTNELVGQIQAAQARERHRLSREIHDRVAGGVSAALWSLELYALDGGRTQARADTVRVAFTESLGALEWLSDALFQPLDDEGLRDKIDRYLRVIDGPHPTVACRFIGDDAVVSVGVAGELFLIIREAVRNALRHAEADRIGIWIEVCADEVRCRITDDGTGFVPSEVERTGRTGLSSMRERAQALGGTVLVTSARVEGTTVEIVVPLRSETG